MTAQPPLPAIDPLEQRAEVLFQEHRSTIFVRTDRMFAVLMACQWVAGIVAAFVVSPRTWAGMESRTHVHVWSALLIGGAISAGPILLAIFLPGRTSTRHAVAVGQMLTSALLIHLSGGRIETHFHVFGSLAFIAFYRDWAVIVTATVVVAADHLVRGFVWPESVYGISNAGTWRWLEHAGWVVFEDIVLFLSCIRGIRELRLISRRRAELEATNSVIEEKVRVRTSELAESEERFRIVVRAAKEVIWDTNLALDRTWWSDEVRTLFGFSTDQVQPNAEWWFLRIHPDDRAKVREAQVAIRSGALDEWTGEYRLIRAYGSVAHVSAHCLLLKDSHGRPSRVIGAVSDVTARRFAEQRLRLQHAVAHVLSSAPDLDHACDEILPAVGQTLGWTFGAVWTIDSKEGLLRSPRSWAGDQKFAEFSQVCRETRLHKGVGIPGRIWADSKPLWVQDVAQDASFPRGPHAARCGLHSAFAFPILLSGEFFGVIEFFSPAILPPDQALLDLVMAIGTQIGQFVMRKQAEGRACEQEELARQSQKMESVGRLAAGVAHEINTPIQYVGDNLRFLEDAFRSLGKTIEGYAEFRKGIDGAAQPDLERRMDEVLREADVAYLEGEVPKALAQSLDGVERVSRIVRAMKEFSHPGAQEKTPTDLNRAIDTTTTVARNEWKYVADLETEFDEGLPLVPCLPGDINQVFLNLIVNASHAIGDAVQGKEGAKGKITIRTRKDGEWAEVRIADTGTGIPEAVRPKLFEPFFTTKGVGKGTGQGLALARAVVVGKHQGTIGFETEVGKGTAFVIRLPLSNKLVSTGG